MPQGRIGRQLLIVRKPAPFRYVERTDRLETVYQRIEERINVKNSKSDNYRSDHQIPPHPLSSSYAGNLFFLCHLPTSRHFTTEPPARNTLQTAVRINTKMRHSETSLFILSQVFSNTLLSEVFRDTFGITHFVTVLPCKNGALPDFTAPRCLRNPERSRFLIFYCCASASFISAVASAQASSTVLSLLNAA